MLSFFNLNIVFVALIVAVIGKLMTSTIFKCKESKLRKILLPVILILFGVCLMLIIFALNGNCFWGDAIVQGIVASVISQFVYDKVHDNLKKLEE